MTTVVAQRSPAAATPQGYQGATASAQPTEHAAGPGGVLMTDPTPGAEGEATELEAIAEPPREADGATDGGNNPSAEDATTTPEGEGDAAAAAQPSQNNLIINYLPSHVTEIELRNMFAVHGDLAHVKVVYDRSTGKSMGYGFVKFTTNEAAAAATAAINGMAIDRKRIKVSVARPSSKDIKNSKLYVTNLPDHFSQDNVIEVFQQYGKIIECRTLVDPKTTISRCTAFVQFDTRREAKDALKFMNGHSLPGAKKGLLVKFAEDHHRRLQRQEQGQNAKGRGMEGNQMGGGQYGQHGPHQNQHQGKGKGGRKGRGGGGGRGGGMYRNNNQGMGGRHGHPPHMAPGFLNPAMGMHASPDGSPMGQNMMGRYGMQLPTGGPAAAAAAQQAAAYNAAQVAHNTYGMMQLNNAMSMMNVAGGNVPGGRDGSGGAGGGDGGAGVGGPAGGFGVPPPPGAGIGGGRSAMMRGGAEHGHPPQPVMPQMLSPTTYGSAGAGMGYVNDIKKPNLNMGGGGAPATQAKHQQQQQLQTAAGDRGPLEQQQQQQQANNHGPPFVLRGV